MLGTANTLIEMSSSATNLVKRLDAVREGIDKASMDTEKREETTDSPTLLREHHMGDKMDRTQEEKTKSVVFSVAAVTKLLAESPDDVWRAIDSASLNNIASGSGKRALLGRELSNFKAATALRAAWIYVLCQEAWKWLSEGLKVVDLGEDMDANITFPYISKQWLTLSPMRSGIVNVAHAGLAGWFSSEADNGKRWEDGSSSYMATLTFLLTLGILEGTPISDLRDQLLQRRKYAIEEQLRRRGTSPSQSLPRLMKCTADTLIHCIRAFVLVDDDSGLPHLASDFKVIASEQQKDGEQSVRFPPLAYQALSTLSSNTIFLEHLPTSIRQFSPNLGYRDAISCQQSTPEALQEWGRFIREQGKEGSFLDTINRLDTIVSIGEAQSHLWESLDQCVVVAEKVCKSEQGSLRRLVEEELRALAELLDRLLLQRLDRLCKDWAAELSKVVSQSTLSALDLLREAQQSHGVIKREVAQEKNPLQFVFETDDSSLDLESTLRLQTPLAQQVVSSLEKKAESLVDEIEAYTSYIQKGALRRKKRMQKRKREEDSQAISVLQDERTKKVLGSYQKAFDSARLLLVDELKRQVEDLGVDAASQNGTRYLFLARIASALQHSETLRGSREKNLATSGEHQFHQGLAALREQIIEGWVLHVVKDAIATYSSKINASHVDSTFEEQGRPSSALVESFLRLVDGTHTVGCNYSTEMMALGRQLFFSFVDAWLVLYSSSSDNKQNGVYVVDSQVLLVLLKGSEGKIKEGMREKLEEISNGNRINEGQIESALQRLRLVLLPLHPHLATRSSATKKRHGEVPSSPRPSAIKGR